MEMSFPEQANWAPLQSVLGDASQCAPFTFMGIVHDGRYKVKIHLYKHQETRRYINIDEAGHCYVYQHLQSYGDSSKTIDCYFLTDRDEAIRHVLED